MKRSLNPGLIIFATLFGNTLEWFDYLAFAFLAPTFAINFFPSGSGFHSLSAVLAGFSLGNLFRPIGALIFGYIGDRFGRKIALIGSILLMTLPTLIMGALPTYAQIGTAAAILLVIMRLLQGIATGGEFPCSMIFLVESAPPRSQGVYGSFAYVGMVLGIFIGGADYFILNHYFSDTISSWGWRSVYFFGALMGLIALFLRSKLHETHPFQGLKEAHEIQKHPLQELIRVHKFSILKVFGIQILQTAGFNLLISFSIIYFTGILNLSFLDAAKLNLVFLGTLFITIPIAGRLSDRIGHKKWMIRSAWSHIICSLPLYWMLQIEGLRPMSLIGLGLLAGSYMGPTVALFCNLFPTKIRLSGVALGYNLSVALIGGICPLGAFWLIHKTENPVAPAFFLIGAALISLFTLKTVRRF